MKKIGLLTLLFSLFVTAFSQPKIQFDKTIHDFGNVKEEGGKVTGRFEFTNVGDSALILVTVKPNCGCTAANYTKTLVAPGEKGFIEAVYDPNGRPGPISKSIAVTTNEPVNSMTVIFIKGSVEKRPPTVFELAGYIVGQGMVRFKNITLRKDILNTEIQYDTLLIRNFDTRETEVQFIDMEKKPYIKEVYRSFEGALKPDEEGKIVLQYDASQRNEFGYVRDDVRVSIPGDEKEPNKMIFYNVNIKEDFSGLTKKERELAPKIVLDTLFFDFGEVKKNDTRTKSCTITNQGKTPLIIRNMQSSINAISSSVKSATIAPGQSLAVEFTYKGVGRYDEQKLTIDIICNDPDNSELPVTFRAVLLK